MRLDGTVNFIQKLWKPLYFVDYYLGERRLPSELLVICDTSRAFSGKNDDMSGIVCNYLKLQKKD